MEDYTKPTKRDFNQDLYILHVGTNDLSLDVMQEVISSCIIDTAKSLMTEKNKLIISNSVSRRGQYIQKGKILSKVIHKACHEENLPVINHNNINPHLNQSKLHYDNYGNSVFVKNIANFLSNLIWRDGRDNSDFIAELSFFNYFTAKFSRHSGAFQYF